MAIEIDPAHRGALHRTAGVPTGRRIPVHLLRRLAHSPDPTTRRRAVFALNARKWNHK